MSDQPWENRGDCNCEKCGVACFADELANPYAGNPYGPSGDELWCAACIQSAGEAKDESDFADYHGGTGSDAMYENAARKGDV